MLVVILVTFVDLFCLIFNFLLLARVLMSWFIAPDANPATRLIFDLTEPVLSPVRRLLPRMEVLDLAPLATFFALQLIQQGAHLLLTKLG